MTPSRPWCVPWRAGSLEHGNSTMELDELRELVDELHDEADDFERIEARVPAHLLLRDVAHRMEEHINEWWTKLLTPTEAASECSWSQETIQKRIGDSLPQAGEPYKPRVRRCDLHAVVAGRVPPEGPAVAEKVLMESV